MAKGCLKIQPEALAPAVADWDEETYPVPANLLHANWAGKAITVTLDTFPDGFMAGDAVQLVLASGPLPLEAIREVGGSLVAQMTLPPAATTAAGNHVMAYRLRAASGCVLDGPLEQVYSVLLDPPGGHLPARLETKIPLSEGVILDQFPEGLPFLIHGYEGMAPMDMLFFIVDDKSVAAPLIIEDTHSRTPFDVMIPTGPFKSFDGLHSLWYEVRGRAVDDHIPSEKLSFETIAHGVGTLEPPIVVAAQNDRLIDDSDAHANGGAAVAIPFIPAASPTDTVVVTWGAYRSNPHRIDNRNDSSNYALIATAPYGAVYDTWFLASVGADQKHTANVGYFVQRGGMRAGKAPDVPVDVNLYIPGGGGEKDPDPTTPWRDVLLPPTVEAADGEVDVINAQAYVLPGKVRIPRHTSTAGGANAYLADGDIIRVLFGGNDLPPYTYTAAADDLGKDFIEVPLPPVSISGTRGAVGAAYRVTRQIDGGTGTALSPTKNVTVFPPEDAPGDGRDMPPPIWINRQGGKTDVIQLLDMLHAIAFQIPTYGNKKIGDTIKLTGIVRAEQGGHLRESQRWIALGNQVLYDNPLAYFILDDLNPWTNIEAPMTVEFRYQVFGLGGTSSRTSESLHVKMDLTGIAALIGARRGEIA